MKTGNERLPKYWNVERVEKSKDQYVTTVFEIDFAKLICLCSFLYFETMKP